MPRRDGTGRHSAVPITPHRETGPPTVGLPLVASPTSLVKRLLVGRPFKSDRLQHTLLPKRIALPVFASDALSSVAYAPDEILLTLSVGGAAFFDQAPASRSPSTRAFRPARSKNPSATNNRCHELHRYAVSAEQRKRLKKSSRCKPARTHLRARNARRANGTRRRSKESSTMDSVDGRVLSRALRRVSWTTEYAVDVGDGDYGPEGWGGSSPSERAESPGSSGSQAGTRSSEPLLALRLALRRSTPKPF
jgi:hypothetical protein